MDEIRRLEQLPVHYKLVGLDYIVGLDYTVMVRLDYIGLDYFADAGVLTVQVISSPQFQGTMGFYHPLILWLDLSKPTAGPAQKPTPKINQGFYNKPQPKYTSGK